MKNERLIVLILTLMFCTYEVTVLFKNHQIDKYRDEHHNKFDSLMNVVSEQYRQFFIGGYYTAQNRDLKIMNTQLNDIIKGKPPTIVKHATFKEVQIMYSNYCSTNKP